MRLPAQLDIGPYTIHLDVLTARVLRQRRRIRRWSIVALTLTMSTLMLGALAWGLVPWLHGTGAVALEPYPADATVTINGQPLAAGATLLTLRSGAHTLTAQRPNTFPVSVDFTVTREQTVTLTLPPLRQIPSVQPVTLPNPDATWQQIAADASGGWRLSARAPASTSVQPGWGPAAAEASIRSLLHLDAGGLTRLSVLETYPVADELITAAGDRYWATWETQQPATPGIAGFVTIATPSGTQVISTTQQVRGLWWAPDGRALLVARRNEQGQALWLLDPTARRTIDESALITIPGAVQSVHWQPDGLAAVVISAAESPAPTRSPTGNLPAIPTIAAAERVPSFPTRSAVLLRIPSTGRAVATRLQAPPNMAGGAVLLAWSRTDLWWGADTGLGLALDRITLADGASTRLGTLSTEIVALTALPDATLRMVLAQPDGSLTVARWPEYETLFTIPTIQLATGGLRPGGLWAGRDLLVVGDPSTLWYVQIEPEALP
ncbi:MAG: hypothetical protein AB4911_18690 [Oscillochloridaceae bacterium umkhey_bin13]